jgi:uncharacterized repeat protein (TIGR03803 family)
MVWRVQKDKHPPRAGVGWLPLAKKRIFLLVVLLCALIQIGRAQTENILYSFTGGTDGGYPYAGVVRDAKGNLYGTTAYGGVANCGTVFEVTPAGQEQVLHSFSGADGAYPWAGLLMDAKGNLYGTTTFGGALNYGAVFELTSTREYKLLHSFSAKDGASPYGALIRDAEGNLYGTTAFGGSLHHGTVFRITPNRKLNVLYNFAGGTDGASPYAGLVRDAAGDLFGTTAFGGASGNGTVFRVDSSGKETVLHAFGEGLDGATPYAGLVQDRRGTLYGTTFVGGSYGLGTVFRVSAGGVEKVLLSFDDGNGQNPYGGLVLDSSNNLYGTTLFGGQYLGTVFQLSSSGIISMIYYFGDLSYQPYSGVVRDGNGNLYGTTLSYQGGGAGTVFELTP